MDCLGERRGGGYGAGEEEGGGGTTTFFPGLRDGWRVMDETLRCVVDV